jgi:ribose 5-phosphate isomerase A
MPDGERDGLKRMAALRAVEYVRDGMAVGLGTGSTAEPAVRELGRRVREEGLKIRGVPTSKKTERLAREVGIPLTTLDECSRLDLTIDGADEVLLPSLDGIKGMGGALLYEKIVALATEEEIFVVDESKIVRQLGTHSPLPVEVVQFGWTLTRDRVESLGCRAVRRGDTDGRPFVTDAGNYLLECTFEGIPDPYSLSRELSQITGVVEHGLFLGIARRVVIAGQSGVRVVERD